MALTVRGIGNSGMDLKRPPPKDLSHHHRRSGRFRPTVRSMWSVNFKGKEDGRREGGRDGGEPVWLTVTKTTGAGFLLLLLFGWGGGGGNVCVGGGSVCQTHFEDSRSCKANFTDGPMRLKTRLPLQGHVWISFSFSLLPHPFLFFSLF